MNHFPIHTIESAPTQSQPVLRSLNESFGFVPNIAGAMAGSPTLINGFIGLFQRVHAGTFTEAEIQTVLLTDAVVNRAAWAVAFHTFLALERGVAAADVQAVRGGGSPADQRLGALSLLARNLIERRGHADPSTLASFFQAGFQTDQVLEVIAIVAASTITNYVDNIAMPPVEKSFQVHEWKEPNP